MSAFETLLEVQERDTTADRLRHRRSALPERSELAALEDRLSALDSSLQDARGRRDDVARRQQRLESDIRALDDRISEVERRLYSGTVSASRELQAMAGEVEAMKARRSALEDEALATLEVGEPLAAEVTSLEQARESLFAEADKLRAAIAEEEARIDEEVARELAARTRLADAVPSPLLETYERLRARMGGVGAARLVGSSCSGCHLSLPMSELARIKKEPPDALVFCDQCGRILVR